MAMQFEGKVAFITGAARGRAVRTRSGSPKRARTSSRSTCASRCHSVPYPMSSPEDLDETVNLVEKTGRRIVAEQGDVRDFERLEGGGGQRRRRTRPGRLRARQRRDLPGSGRRRSTTSRRSSTRSTCMLNGVYYTIEAALPHLVEHGDGGRHRDHQFGCGTQRRVPTLQHHESRRWPATRPPNTASMGLMRYYATSLAEKNIRVNTVHPSGVATPMIINDAIGLYFGDHPESRPALQQPAAVPPMDRRRGHH